MITLTIAIYQMLSATKKNASTNSDLIIISQLNHFTFVSALLLPVLRLNLALPLRFQGLGTRRLVRPYLGGFPTIFYQLTKASQNFFRLLGKISYADFAARTFLAVLYHYHKRRNFIDNLDHFSFITIDELTRLVREFEERFQNETEDPDRFLTLPELEDLWGKLVGDTNAVYSDMVNIFLNY